MVGKKNKGEAQSREFNSCDKSDCRFYGRWLLGWNNLDATLAIPRVGSRTGHRDISNAAYIRLLAICLSCKHFKSHDNYLLIGDENV